MGDMIIYYNFSFSVIPCNKIWVRLLWELLKSMFIYYSERLPFLNKELHWPFPFSATTTSGSSRPYWPPFFGLKILTAFTSTRKRHLCLKNRFKIWSKFLKEVFQTRLSFLLSRLEEFIGVMYQFLKQERKSRNYWK